jgi:hypothetical protein
MSILMQIYNFFKTIQMCISWWEKKNFDNYQDARYVRGGEKKVTSRMAHDNFCTFLCISWVHYCVEN